MQSWHFIYDSRLIKTAILHKERKKEDTKENRKCRVYNIELQTGQGFFWSVLKESKSPAFFLANIQVGCTHFQWDQNLFKVDFLIVTPLHFHELFTKNFKIVNIVVDLTIY